MKHATIRLTDTAIKLIIDALMQYEPKDHGDEIGLDILIPFLQQVKYEEEVFYHGS